MFNKKNLWIVALIAALSIAFIGCLDAPKAVGSEDDVETVVFDLAAVLADLSPRTIATQSAFDATFGEEFVQSGGEFANNHVEFIIFDDGGVNKLRINAKASWGAGLDLRNEEIQFRGGDKIEIKGLIESGAGDKIILNTDHSGFKPAGGTELTSPFSQTITLSSEDASNINAANPKTIRIRPHTGAGVFVLEQVKVTGMRAAGSTPGTTPKGPSYFSPDGGIGADGDYFYLDLGEFLLLGQGADGNQINVGIPPTLKELDPDFVAFNFPQNNSGNRSSVAIGKLSDSQVDAIMAGSLVNYEIIAKDNTVLDYRAALGAPTQSAWNSTGVTGALQFGTEFTTLSGAFSWDQSGSKKDRERVSYFIIQINNHNKGADDAYPAASELTIKSIRLTVVAAQFATPPFTFTIETPKAGHEAQTTVESGAFKGTVVWEPALLDGVTLAPDYPSVTLPGKRFARNTVYKAVLILEAAPGYNIDYIQPNTEFTVNGTANKTYNPINKRITGITFTSTSSTWEIDPVEIGVFDTALNASYTRTGTKVWSLADNKTLALTNSKPILWAGTTNRVWVNDGINITGRSGAGDCPFLLIGATPAVWGHEGVPMTPATNKYKITVYGFIIGTLTGGEKLQLQKNGDGYGVLASVDPVPASHNQFKLVLDEVPSDYNVSLGDGRGLRINSTGSDPFRITLIEVEDLGAR